MCGFIATYNKNKKFSDIEIKKLRTILDHRGPDHNAFIKVNNLLLVHNRLSIIDLNKQANQPYINTATGNIIVFNGEIYNYNQLKEKYKDIEWKTNSDTEVILKLFEKFGENFVSKLNGIFAFCIYHKNSNSIYIYRDRFGIKPIYYYFDKDKFSFASEIKALLVIHKDIKLNFETVYDYIENGLNVHSNKTFFNNIYSLQPGNFVKINLNNPKIFKRNYWNANNFYSKKNTNITSIKNLEYLITDSFKLNMVSDVEVALSLSSGLDSLLMYSEIKNLGYENIKSFTYGFEDKKYDEIKLLKKRGLDIKNHYCYYFKPKSLLPELKKAIKYYETPLGGLGSLCSYYLMQKVKNENIKVILSGEGGDEIFGGYQYYFPAFFSDLKNKDQIRKNLKLYNYENQSNLKMGSPKFNNWISNLNFYKILAPDGTKMSNHYLKNEIIDNFNFDSHKLEKFKGRGDLNRVIFEDIVSKKLPKLLHFQDRAASSIGVESRVPFLDHRLVEAMIQTPNKLKINNGMTKSIIRNMLAKKYNINISKTKKLYVSDPQREWIKKDCKNEILEILKDGYLEKSNLFEMKKFYSDYENYSKSKKLGNSFFVWKILNLELLLSSFKL